MKELLEEFQQKFATVVKEAERLCFMTRDKQLQQDACNHLVALCQEATSLKKGAISDQDENLANAILSYEEMISALRDELRMWIALKADNTDAAWNFLVDAQMHAHWAMQAHQVAAPLVGYVQKLRALEEVLFAPMAFFSVGMIIEYAECSICGQEYGECDHIKGIAYMGEICARHIKHAKRLEEVSIVSVPANKRCRIGHITDEQGVFRDVLTWRPVPPSSAEMVEGEIS